MFKKSHKSPVILCYHGHILMENRSELVVGAEVSHAEGFAGRASALQLFDCWQVLMRRQLVPTRRMTPAIS
ncbi:hypothetical protein BH160DRAFT_7152 [Burkholderia sp. H160]|nr:hypothetical protein BH160DRAFT_7152 [Burkholderia sp. H160]